MKHFYTTITICCLSFSALSQFIQVGQDIDGITGDQSGYSTSLNSDGSRVAIGSPFNSDIGNGNGMVQVYELIAGSWVQMGQNLYGEANDAYGNSVALNDAGDRVVVGIISGDSPIGGAQGGLVMVYEFDGSNWNLLGQVITPETYGDQLGVSVAINASGNRIIVGAQNNNGGGSGAGHARVFEFNGTNWIQLGQDLDGTFSEDFGAAVTIDPSGTIVAIGGPDENSGVVRVYSYNGTIWVQRGSDIVGDQAGDRFGTSVSLTNDGEMVAVGAPIAGSPLKGSVKVYSFSGASWSQKGQTIFGSNNGDQIGNRESIALDVFGDRLIIGSRFSDVNGISSGEGKLYYFNSINWILSGTVTGETSGDEMGQVSISDDGQRVALGARENSDGGNVAGHVRVYDLGNVGIDDLASSTISVYPNPSNGTINFKCDKAITDIEVFDLQGRQLDTYEYSNQLYLRQPKGIYLLKIIQNGTCLGVLRIEIQ